MSKIINKFKFPNDNNEYRINAIQLEGKTLEEIKQEIGSNTPTDNGGTISASIAQDDWAALNIENCTYAQVILYNCDISCDSFGLKIYFQDEDVPSAPIQTLQVMRYAVSNNLTIEIINQRLIRIRSENEGLLLITRVDYPRKYLILKPYTDDSQYTSSEGMSFEYFVTR